MEGVGRNGGRGGKVEEKEKMKKKKAPPPHTHPFEALEDATTQPLPELCGASRAPSVAGKGCLPLQPVGPSPAADHHQCIIPASPLLPCWWLWTCTGLSNPRDRSRVISPCFPFWTSSSLLKKKKIQERLRLQRRLPLWACF